MHAACMMSQNGSASFSPWRIQRINQWDTKHVKLPACSLMLVLKYSFFSNSIKMYNYLLSIWPFSRSSVCPQAKRSAKTDRCGSYRAHTFDRLPMWVIQCRHIPIPTTAKLFCLNSVDENAHEPSFFAYIQAFMHLICSYYATYVHYSSNGCILS